MSTEEVEQFDQAHKFTLKLWTMKHFIDNAHYGQREATCYEKFQDHKCVNQTLYALLNEILRARTNILLFIGTRNFAPRASTAKIQPKIFHRLALSIFIGSLNETLGR